METRRSSSVEPYSEQARTSADEPLEWWRDAERRRLGIPFDSEHPRPSDVQFIEGRDQWENKLQFVLSCVGLSVGLGNIWRFPYQAYNNGGAAFVLAYFILQFLVGKPLYLMEIAIGQFSGKATTRVWDMNPSAKGVGISMCIVSLITAIYYNVIMAYCLYFFFATMQTELPWTVCEEEWVEKYQCIPFRTKSQFCTADVTAMEILGKCTCTGDRAIDDALSFLCIPRNENSTSAAELYFYKYVIQRSKGIEPENLGTPLWKLSLLLLISWVTVVGSLLKGIKSSGKVVYFTATFPYLVLLILLIRSMFLDGAVDGVKYFLIPEWSKILSLETWAAAAGQMFFSLGISFGTIIMYSSYNSFKSPLYSYSLIIATLDFLTSIIGGLVVFTTFGGMAKSIGTSVDKVVVSGYGLAFVVYPEALANMPPAHLWSLIFFFMLFTLGLDSEIAFIEVSVTCIQDEFPKLRKYKSYIAISLGIACYLLGLPGVCPGGDYVVTLMDHYGSEMCVLFVSMFEVISIMWVYGIKRFLNDLEYMMGKKPRGWRYLAFCWAGACPIIITSLNIYRLVTYKSPHYIDKRNFPFFARAIGYLLACVALSPIPIWAGYLLYKSYQSADVVTQQHRKKFLFEPDRHFMPNDGRLNQPVPQEQLPGDHEDLEYV